MSGLTYFNTTDFATMKQKIQAYATSGNADAIVSIFKHLLYAFLQVHKTLPWLSQQR